MVSGAGGPRLKLMLETLPVRVTVAFSHAQKFMFFACRCYVLER